MKKAQAAQGKVEETGGELAIGASGYTCIAVG